VPRLLAVFSWLGLSSLLVEVSRLSSPLTGRVEILNIQRRVWVEPSSSEQWTVAASGT